MGHVGKGYWKWKKNLEENVNHLEEGMSTIHLINQPTEKYTFYINTSQSLHAFTTQIECIVDSSCTHHMDKDASLFSSLSGSP